MAYYVSTPTGSRCLDVCRAHGFREMSCPVETRKGVLGPRNLRVRLDRFALDNGAWLYHQAGATCDYGLFASALASMGPRADFAVVPDIVAGGVDSLRVSEQWLPVVLAATTLALVPVQDGMSPDDIAGLVSDRVGIFVGGSHSWKWTTVDRWASFAHARACYIHVGRVNTIGRADHCADLGVHSADGSSVSRFSITASRFVGATNPNRESQGNLRW